MTLGQDESVFHAYLLGIFRARVHIHIHIHTQPPLHTGNKTWYVLNKVGLRKKSNGPGCHVSGFVGYTLGFGLKILGSSEVLRKCNQNREGQASAVDGNMKEQLLVNPAIRTMMIGANKDGWWDEIKLMHQSEDVIDFLETWDTEKRYQFVGRFDQSVGHNKKNAHALVGPSLGAPASITCVCVPFTTHTHTHTHACTHAHTHTHTHPPPRLRRKSVCIGGASSASFVIVPF